MFGPSAVKDINLSKLDKTLVSKYERYPEIIELLDDWILSPDGDLLDKLRSHTRTLQSIARLKIGTKLYRGFDPKSSYQDTMGLSKKGWLFNEVRDHEVGNTFDYPITRPISFTTDLDIAKAFGKTIVQLVSIPNDYIWITDELSSLISKRRGIGPETQREVIILPPQDLSFKIINK